MRGIKRPKIDDFTGYNLRGAPNPEDIAAYEEAMAEWDRREAEFAGEYEGDDRGGRDE